MNHKNTSNQNKVRIAAVAAKVRRQAAQAEMEKIFSLTDTTKFGTHQTQRLTRYVE